MTPLLTRENTGLSPLLTRENTGLSPLLKRTVRIYLAYRRHFNDPPALAWALACLRAQVGGKP